MKRILIKMACTLLCVCAMPFTLSAQSMSKKFAEKSTVVLLMDKEVDMNATKGTQILIQLVPAPYKAGQSKVSVKVMDLATKHFIHDFEVRFLYKNDIDIWDAGISFLRDNWFVDIEKKNERTLLFHLSNKELGIKTVYTITDVAFYERYSDFSMFNEFRYDNNMEKSYKYLMTFFKKVQPSRRLY